jgi:hypothetical protein
MKIAKSDGSVVVGETPQTSAALGTASQNTSILISPWVVWRVTDCDRQRRGGCSKCTIHHR